LILSSFFWFWYTCSFLSKTISLSISLLLAIKTSWYNYVSQEERYRLNL
jgi:hypothetical protein